MTMFRKLNFWPLPKAPGAGDPKNCASACAIHVSNSHTKSSWISKKKIFDPPPNPPWYPQVLPLGLTQAAEWKFRLICYISLSCEKIHKVWFKNLWNLVFNSDLMIFDLLAPGGGNPKNGAFAYAIHDSNSHTKSGWISEKKIWPPPPTPHGTPKSHPWGMTQAAKLKSRLICFISFICEKTHKVWFKNLWNWLSNWNLMIFNDILPFGPYPGPQGVAQKKMCCCKPHSCEQLTHQIWLDFVQWFRRR